MKRLSLLVLGFCLVFFTACSEKSTSKTNDVIIVGTSGGYFPFSYFESDVLKGFEIDVWREIAKKLDRKVEFKTAKFSGLFGMLETKKINTISNQITKTPTRLEKYLFSDTYVFDGASIIIHKDTNDINSLEDLKGKKVGVGLGTNYASIIKEYDKKNEINVITYDGGGLQNDTQLKRIDAYIQDRTSAVESIKKIKAPLKIAGSPIKLLENGFPFLRTKENEKFVKQVNKALKSLKDEGKLKEISIKWFDTDITKK